MPVILPLLVPHSVTAPGFFMLSLHDEIADLDVMIAAIVDELTPELIKRNAIGTKALRSC